MKLIPIYYKDIFRNALYMHDTEGRYDLLGQILFTGFNIDIPMKTRVPSELNTIIHPFTIQVRRYCKCCTPITLQLLANTGLSGKQQIVAANKLLLQYEIELVPTE